MGKVNEVYVGDRKKCEECKYSTYISGAKASCHDPIYPGCYYIEKTGKSRVFRLGKRKKSPKSGFCDVFCAK